MFVSIQAIYVPVTVPLPVTVPVHTCLFIIFCVFIDWIASLNFDSQNSPAACLPFGIVCAVYLRLFEPISLSLSFSLVLFFTLAFSLFLFLRIWASVRIHLWFRHIHMNSNWTSMCTYKKKTSGYINTHSRLKHKNRRKIRWKVHSRSTLLFLVLRSAIQSHTYYTYI